MPAKRAETRSLTIAAPPATVHAYVADPRNLPDWAPSFAPDIRFDDDRPIVVGDGGEFEVAMLTEPGAGTVDIVSAADHTRGLFARVLPNGDGSELLFTLFFAADTDADALETQLATLDAELAAVSAATAGA